MSPDAIYHGSIYRFKSGLRRVTRLYGYRSTRVVVWEPEPPDNYSREVLLSQFAKRVIEEYSPASPDEKENE